MSEHGLRSGAVASAAGVNVETLRYYERRGLLREPARSLGGHRRYPPEVVNTLRVIKAAQQLGFTLDEVAELLAATMFHRHGDAGLQARGRVKLAELEAKLEELTRVRDLLRTALDAGCDDLLACVDSPWCPISFSTAQPFSTALPSPTSTPSSRG